MAKIKRHKFRKKNNWFIHLYFIIASILAIVPFLMVVSVSFSDEMLVTTTGFSLIPKGFTASAYQAIFKSPDSIVNAYITTIISAVGGTAINIVVTAMMGYALSHNDFYFKKAITTYLAITMFVSGGMIPSYIINTQYLHLNDTILIYLIPGILSASEVFVFRTFFSQIPSSLVESAVIDGAKEYQVLCHVIIPMSKPLIATYSFMGLLSRWNNFTTPLYYIQNPKLYNLQFLLQKILQEAQFLAQLKSTMPSAVEGIAMPSETLKFAMCVVAAGPIVIAFPFFQKYFSKGITVGAVKG